MKGTTVGFLLGLTTTLFITLVFISGAIWQQFIGIPLLDTLTNQVALNPLAKMLPQNPNANVLDRKILSEESAVISIADQVSPAVVTVAIKKNEPVLLQPDPFLDPFGFFSPRSNIDQQYVERDIGTGFIVSSDGLIVTNRHVVEDRDAEYEVITQDGTKYDVTKIDRDPTNDLAIIKINASDLPQVELGDSQTLKVGQFVVAIGTALGEYRHTVTTGVISGLSRGVIAGDPYGRNTRQLDNLIQTDAAINPGNSGGPLINSAGQVIGVNVAVVANGQNIGFSIPVQLVKTMLNDFNERGGFGTRAYLGVEYFMISESSALANGVPAGAYLEAVVPGSAAQRAGIESGDIVTKFNNKPLSEYEGGLAEAIGQQRAGDTVPIEIWRDNKVATLNLQLGNND